MAADATALVARYPELEPANTAYPAMVTACLADAELEVDRSVYGTKSDKAVLALAAHYIAINPIGEFARIDKRTDRTTYWIQYEQIRTGLGCGFRVI